MSITIRENNFILINDAKRNICHYYEKYSCCPSSDELAGFALLYMERSKANYEKYFSSYLTADNDVNDIRKCFFETQPIFESYESFINFCVSNEEKAKNINKEE